MVGFFMCQIGENKKGVKRKENWEKQKGIARLDLVVKYVYFPAVVSNCTLCS